MKGQTLISKTRLHRIRQQGYCDMSDRQISDLSFGNSFAYKLCTFLLVIGVATASVELLTFMEIIAFLGVVLPNHPFDYIYNLGLRKLMDKPKLPPRSNQLKFACTMATIHLGITITLFCTEYYMWGYIAGAILIVVAGLVAFFDFCIPSILYNKVFKIKIE